MMKRWWIIAVIAAMFLWTQAEAQDTEIRGVETKLNQVIQNQVKIMNTLEEMKKELKIIKIRAT
jgi:hypothetical protein